MLLNKLLTSLFGVAALTDFRQSVSQGRTRKSANAKIRKDLGLRSGQPGNKLAVRAAKRAVSLSVLK
jgi:hypothetical protein